MLLQFLGVFIKLLYFDKYNTYKYKYFKLPLKHTISNILTKCNDDDN